MFLGDQGRDALIVKKIVTLQALPAIGPPSSIGEVFLGPFYYYLVAPFLFIFRLNPVGLAVGVALLSCIGLYSAYIIGKRTLPGKGAFYFFLLTTFSYELVRIARFSWNPNLLPFFAFITIYLLSRSCDIDNKKWFYFSGLFGIFFGLSFQLHHLAGLLVLPVAVYFILALVRQKNFRLLLVPLVSFGGFLLTLVPLIIFELRHQFLNTHNLISVFTQQNIVSSGPLYLRLYDINTSFIEFAFHFRFPPLLALALTLGVIGLSTWKCAKKFHPFVAVVILSVVLYLFGFSRVNSSLIPHYYNPIYVCFYFLIAYIFATKKNIVFSFFSFILICLFVLRQAQGYEFISQKGSFQDANPRLIGAFIASRAGKQKINLTTYPTDFTSRDCYQYFIELNGGTVVDGSSAQVTDSMYVLCNKQPCRVINSDSWNVQMFGAAKIDTMWNKDGIAIYKLKHK